MTPASAALRDAWTAQAEWSARASWLKARIGRQRALLLGLLAATAVLGTAGATLSAGGAATGPGRALAAAAAVLAAVAATLRQTAKEVDSIERWTRARSIAEALKEAVFRCRTGTGIYSGANADEVLRAQVERLTADGRNLLDTPLQSPATRLDPPPPLDAAAYVERRVRQQIDGYYLPQARRLLQRRERWQWAQSALLVLGAVLGALIAFLPDTALASWVAVLTTLAGAVGAHIEGSRYSHLAVAYLGTADRLRSLRSRFEDERATGRPVDFGRLVDQAEDAISVENQSWMATWSAARDAAVKAAPR